MDELRLQAHYTTAQVAVLAGLSYRMVDYHTRTSKLLHASIRSARGCGSYRLYSSDDVARARLIAALTKLGARCSVISRVFTHLAENPDDWPQYFFITPEGDVKRGLPLPTACWWIHKGHLLEPAEGVAA